MVRTSIAALCFLAQEALVLALASGCVSNPTDVVASDALRADGTRELRYLDGEERVVIDSSATNGNYAYAPEILFIDGVYHLWACDGNDHAGDAIRYTTSSDGTTWSTPTIVFDLANQIAGIQSHACDPSVVRFQPPGSRVTYYYLYFTTTPDREGGANGVARTPVDRPAGPYQMYIGGDPSNAASWSDRRDVVPGFVTVPVNPCAGRQGCYGAGQPSVVVRDGTIHMWYTDTTAGPNGTAGVGGIFHATSTDGVRFSPGVATSHANQATVSVKYDREANKYILFALSANHGTNGQVQASWSDDGVIFTPFELLPGPVPNYSHNPGVTSDPQGHLDFSRPVYIGFGAPWDRRPDYTNDPCRGPNNGACWGYWDLFLAPIHEGNMPPPDRRPAGFFNVGGAIYYSNGNDAFCGYESPSHLLSCNAGIAPAAPVANRLPRDMRNDGSCTCGRAPAPTPSAPATMPAGLFVFGSTVYYSNGVDAYCGLTSPDHLQSCFPGMPVPSASAALPTGMRADPPCQCGILAPAPTTTPPAMTPPPPQMPPPPGTIPSPSSPPSDVRPAGFFSAGGTVYFSNGDIAYCGFATPAQLAGCNTSSQPITPSTLPSAMRYDGVCECGATLTMPAGFFQHQGTVYYSNGSVAFCGISSPEQLNRCSGGNPGSLPETPTLPLRLRNDGVCGC